MGYLKMCAKLEHPDKLFIYYFAQSTGLMWRG